MPGIPVRVLLVDDDEDDYIITRDLIARIGDRRYRLDWVNNYDDAFTAVPRGEHEICLLDYRLGERTGLASDRLRPRDAGDDRMSPAPRDGFDEHEEPPGALTAEDWMTPIDWSTFWA